MTKTDITKFGRSFNITALCLLYVLSMFLFIPPQHTKAANAFIDPNGDGTITGWTSTGANYYTEIDEATRQPTAPTTTDYIQKTGGGTGTAYMRMNSITGVSTVSSITVWVYHNDGLASGRTSVRLYDDNESTTRSAQTTLTNRTSNTWDSATFGSLSLTQSQLDTLSIQIQTSKVGGGSNPTITTYAMYADVTYTAGPAYEQSGYRLFNNSNSTNVGSALAGANSAGSLGANGAQFRARILLHNSGANLSTNGDNFKLQFAGKGAGSCASPSGTPGTYTDVTTSTAISYYDNATPTDGSALTSNGSDPTHSSDTIRNQTYEEANNATNSQAAINTGEDGMWDFSLYDNTAGNLITYCFRVVKSDGGTLTTYTHYPEVTTADGNLTVDIVNSTGTPVASPSYAMSSSSVSFACQTSTGTLGDTNQRIRVDNGRNNSPNWSMSIAATSGSGALWTGSSGTYDFNDPSGSPAGCADGGDSDSKGGQLTINPSVGTIGPQAGCATTGITLGSSTAFNSGTVDSITLASAGATADSRCYWDFTGISLSQQIAPEQLGENYTLNFTVTVVAT